MEKNSRLAFYEIWNKLVLTVISSDIVVEMLHAVIKEHVHTSYIKQGLYRIITQEWRMTNDMWQVAEVTFVYNKYLTCVGQSMSPNS